MSRKDLATELLERLGELERGEIKDEMRCSLQEMKDDVAAYQQKLKEIDRNCRFCAPLFTLFFLLQLLNNYYPSGWFLALMLIVSIPTFYYSYTKWLWPWLKSINEIQCIETRLNFLKIDSKKREIAKPLINTDQRELERFP